MGANTSVYDKAGKLQPYHYPYGIGHKLWQFPWKFYITNSKGLRVVGYGCFITAFLQYKAQLSLRSEFMQNYWKEKRAGYAHTFFCPPGPPKYDRPPTN